MNTQDAIKLYRYNSWANRRFTYLSGTAGSHELQDLLTHVVNHGTFHRGQLTSMIRQLGVAPPSTDFVVFRAEEFT